MSADIRQRRGSFFPLPGLALLAALLAAVSPASAQSGPTNDYPTVARADYVFGCMAANGQTRDVLEKCACSIDVIASILPYEKYVQAETVMSVRQRSGEATSIFRADPGMREKVAELKRAQVEAEIRCF